MPKNLKIKNSIQKGDSTLCPNHALTTNDLVDDLYWYQQVLAVNFSWTKLESRILNENAYLTYDDFVRLLVNGRLG